MRVRIAVIKNDEEWAAFGDDESNDVQKLSAIQNTFPDFVGEVHFIEADLPERLLHVEAEVVQ